MIGTGWGFSMLSLRFIDREVDSGWVVSVDFVDSGFANDDSGALHVSTEGKLHSRYMVKDTSNGLSGAVVALNAIRADLDRLGVRNIPSIRPLIFVSNREDSEMGKDVTPVENIPAEDVVALRNYAQTHNFDILGI